MGLGDALDSAHAAPHAAAVEFSIVADLPRSISTGLKLPQTNIFKSWPTYRHQVCAV